MKTSLPTMDSKRRSSLDDPGVTTSALRRLTQTPRLGLRRPGTTSSSSSSASSIASHEHDDQNSCVARETSHDECALNRFMVWAAVKRNSCQKMTHEERRECPLLRCRKRFPNHELMLQHLFVCEELAAGEYWCYDCTRVERFTDAKCKRCLGHPSKRRKIMFMARNFFSSLGHRSKASSLPDLDMDVDEAPPSYNEALDVPPAPLPQQAELQANEIHEIDSNEVPLSTIIEDAEEDPISLPLQMPQPVPPVPPVSTLTLSRPKIHPAELESANWQLPAQPETVAPANLNLFNDDQQARSPDRPTLQVRTTDLAQYRAQAKRRSKMLAPSSSVRSTASTNSTNSTNSTASSGSYAISPMSSWSGGWARVNGFDSTLTSPADDFAPSNPFASSYKPECEFPSTNPFQSQDNQPAVGDQLNVNLEQTFSTELPADMPMVDVIPPSDPMGPSLDPFQPSFPFDAATASDLSLGTALSLNQDSQSQALPSKLESDSTGSHRGSAHSLVSTAWDALQMHVAESMERLRDIQDNHLVDQLRAMSPELVASTGLKALDSILNRTIVESPVDLLCFVHLVYSFSLVIHEQDAPTRGTKLFSQAMSYASWLTKLDRHPYFVIVDALWKPSGMDKSEVVGLMRKSSSAAATRLKGKQPQQLAPEPSTDSLAFVAQFFLDELEHSAVQETNRASIQASELCIQHMKDTTFDLTKGSQVDVAVNFMQSILTQQYSDVPKFVSRLGELRSRVNSSYGSTARRLELELMNVGKTSLAPDIFFDNYVPCVREQIDSLYSLVSPQFNSRLVYHRLGVKLIDSIIPAPTNPNADSNDDSQLLGGIGSIDDFIGAMSPNLDEFDFSAISDLDCSPSGGFTEPTPDFTAGSLSVTPNTNGSGRGPSTAATSPPSLGPTPSTNNNKVESVSCCEICGYRPEGDPRWFPGSMAKHKKLQHATSPPKIYHCRYPGCTSKYTNRPDNLRQHQIKKGHFVDGEEDTQDRPSKRKKMG